MANKKRDRFDRMVERIARGYNDADLEAGIAAALRREYKRGKVHGHSYGYAEGFTEGYRQCRSETLQPSHPVIAKDLDAIAVSIDRAAADPATATIPLVRGDSKESSE